MDVLLRHTVLGEGIRLIKPSYLAYADEQDHTLLKNLATVQEAQSNQDRADETTALLSHAEETYGSEALLVEWYDSDDSEVKMHVQLRLETMF